MARDETQDLERSFEERREDATRKREAELRLQALGLAAQLYVHGPWNPPEKVEAQVLSTADAFLAWLKA